MCAYNRGGLPGFSPVRHEVLVDLQTFAELSCDCGACILVNAPTPIRVGDSVLLRERVDDGDALTGNQLVRRVTHMRRCVEGLAPGWILVSLRRLP